MDMMIPMIATITENTAVHIEWSERVLRTLAPVKMWKPMSMMLFASNMKPENT